MRTRWIIANAVGEACGIAVVATVYAALDRGLLSQAGPSILSAGAWEGLSLGAAQAWMLRQYGVSAPRWIALTIFGAVLGYGLSVLGGAGSGGEDGGAEPPLWLILLLGAAMGVAMGALMGALQAFAVRRALSTGRWILANAVGWAPAMAIIMLGATLVPGALPLWGIALVGAISGGLAGGALGSVTSWALPKPPLAG